MDYVKFGKAGVKVSPIALGLGFRGQPSPDEGQRLIEHAIDSGVNFIDCANIYRPSDSGGLDTIRSEDILGRVLKTRRDDIVITTKVFSRVGDGPNDTGGSRYHIMREIERSLKRLRTDHVDAYLVHSYDDQTPLDETLRAMDDIVTQGKAIYVGACNYQAWQVSEALGIQDRINADRLVCVQNPYSLLNRAVEDEMFDVVRDEGLGVMAFSPLGVGLLSNAYLPGEPPPPHTLWGDRRSERYIEVVSGATAKVIETAHEIARERGVTVAQVAINWILSHPEVTVAISGSDTIEQLDDVLGALSWSLSQDERGRLDEVSAEAPNIVQL